MCQLAAFLKHAYLGAVQSSSRPIGWSQQELAKPARVGIVTIHQLESGTQSGSAADASTSIRRSASKAQASNSSTKMAEEPASVCDGRAAADQKKNNRLSR